MSALSRMRARFNLRAGALPEEMSLCKYSRSSLLSSTRYFFFISSSPPKMDQSQDKPFHRNFKSSLTEEFLGEDLHGWIFRDPWKSAA